MGPKTPLLGDKLPARRKSPEVLLSGSTWSSPPRMYLVVTEITCLFQGKLLLNMDTVCNVWKYKTPNLQQRMSFEKVWTQFWKNF